MGTPEPDHRNNDVRSIRNLERNPSDLLVPTDDVIQLVRVTEMVAGNDPVAGALTRFKIVTSQRTTDQYTIRIRAVWDVGSENHSQRGLHEAKILISENTGSEEIRPTATTLFFRYASDREYVPFTPKNGMTAVSLAVALKDFGVRQAIVTPRAELRRRRP